MSSLERKLLENHKYHKEIVNDFVETFHGRAQMQHIQNDEDVEALEEEREAPPHMLTPFVQILLSSEPNKKNLHPILPDQFLAYDVAKNSDGVAYEELVTADEMDWTSKNFGGLRYEDWELDHAEVKRLVGEWRRNVLDPVMAAYMQRKLPWCPDMPEAIEIYDPDLDDNKGDADGDGESERDREHEHEEEEEEEEDDESGEERAGKKKQKQKKAKKKKKQVCVRFFTANWLLCNALVTENFSYRDRYLRFSVTKALHSN